MDLLLKDKVIIVSGGAKGIGEGISKVLAGEGAIPFIIGRNEQDNKATVAEITATGGKRKRPTPITSGNSRKNMPILSRSIFFSTR